MPQMPLFSEVGVSLDTREFDHHDSMRLLRACTIERRQIVGFDDPPDQDKPPEFAPPRGRFLVAYTPGREPVACGGFRAYSHRTGVIGVRWVAKQVRSVAMEV